MKRAATRFSFCSFFRGPCRALQDLYEDWSAIYRNRIPPCLVLPLAAASLPRRGSLQPLQVTPSLSLSLVVLFFFTKPLFSSLLFCLFPSSSTFSTDPDQVFLLFFFFFFFFRFSCGLFFQRDPNKRARVPKLSTPPAPCLFHPQLHGETARMLATKLGSTAMSITGRTYACSSGHSSVFRVPGTNRRVSRASVLAPDVPISPGDSLNTVKRGADFAALSVQAAITRTLDYRV